MAAAEAPTTEIDLRELFRQVRYTPHKGQRLIHANGARHRVVDAGRRFGKSECGGHELTPEAIAAHEMAPWLHDAGKQKHFWIVGPNYDDAEREFRVFYNDCKRLELPFDRPGTYYNQGVPGSHTVSLWDGAFLVECRSAQHPESLDGEGLDGVLMVEAAKMKRMIWHKYIRPAIADKKGWSLWLSTPEGKNHFYDMWQRGQDPKNPAWWSIKAPSWINDIIFPGGRMDEEILAMAMDMSKERFKQEIGAEFTEFVGRVFKDWDEEIHVQDLQYNPDLPLYGAVDYGWRNPFVWLAIQIDHWDNVYVLGEYYVREKDINDIADYLARWPLARNAREFFQDPASPGDGVVLEKKLKMKARSNTGGELKWRLEQIRKWLKPGPPHAPAERQKPKLFVDRSCKNTIYEMDEYRYPDDKSEEKGRPAKEEPLKKDDHTPEALGRFFRGYFGGPSGPSGNNARVRKANMSRSG